MNIWHFPGVSNPIVHGMAFARDDPDMIIFVDHRFLKENNHPPIILEGHRMNDTGVHSESVLKINQGFQGSSSSGYIRLNNQLHPGKYYYPML